MPELRHQHCITLHQGLRLLDGTECGTYLTQLDNWQFNDYGDTLRKEFQFSDFYQTMAFINAIAWIANQENHHPDMNVGYNRCQVEYTTHEVGGLSINDFICAARIDALNGKT